MNDFTKEELDILLNAVSITIGRLAFLGLDIQKHLDLANKIQDMIENYCEHEMVYDNCEHESCTKCGVRK